MPKFKSVGRYGRLSLRVVLIVVFCTLAYLMLTGRQLLSEVSAEPRPVEVEGLSASETRRLGWDPVRLQAVFEYTASLSTDSFVIVSQGRLVGAYGDIEQPYHLHSIRKALLSALVGQHLGAGTAQINLNDNLLELGIDDAPHPLTPLQKTATVRHLLKSMSGINHAAAAEAGLTAEKNRRLGRQENVPGTIWAYNNWDYNALTTIFETRTGIGVGEAFDIGLAEPLGMQDFTREDVSYIEAPELSQHRAAMFHMSARDLVRIGELYLNSGVMNGNSVLPESWVDRVAADFIETGEVGLRSGHSYLWWIPDPQSGLPAGTFWAWGFGQQALFVIPAWQTVIVHQSDTKEFRKRFFGLIRDKAMEPQMALERLALSCREQKFRTSEFCLEHRFTLNREFAKLMLLVANARREK
ncbi:serine hydrolase [Pelagibius sp. Alg239-R121]|uniref:serine hydrolase domain-containing protein n=1 Tax=Pelagibius sp. Alg239-R121 TaxID=2993448 RepID=UPI0024A760D1|nr:serine hydrolase [Pelagibius sp. Alg239-R121]